MTENKINLPERGTERYRILKSLYDRIDKETVGEVEAFKMANEFLETPLSVRGWFRAKEKWDAVKKPEKEKGEKHSGRQQAPKQVVKYFKELPTPIYNQTKKEANTISVAALKKQYTPEEKQTIFKNVAELYSQGARNIMEICESQGVHYLVFWAWVDGDVQLKKAWETANNKNLLSYIRVFKEKFKEYKMNEIMNPLDELWSIHYDYVPGVNRETGMAQMMLVEKGATKHVRPRKLDNETQKLFMQQLQEMYALEAATEMVVQSDFDNMGIVELDAMEDDLKKKMDELGVKDENELPMGEEENGE